MSQETLLDTWLGVFSTGKGAQGDFGACPGREAAEDVTTLPKAGDRLKLGHLAHPPDDSIHEMRLWPDNVSETIWLHPVT